MNTQTIDKMSDTEVREAVRGVYEKQRRADEYEPPWIAMYWAAAYAETGDVSEYDYRGYLVSLTQPPYIVFRSDRSRHVQEDGFLIATTSWIFAARAKSTPIPYRGWVIIDRELSDEVKALERANGLGRGQPTRFFMAYDHKSPVGLSACSGGEIGPCMSLDAVKEYIDGEVR